MKIINHTKRRYRQHPVLFVLATIGDIVILTTICLFFFSGCMTSKQTTKTDTTPQYWQPRAHANMMMVCRSMCNDSGVLRYDPQTGECACRQ